MTNGPGVLRRVRYSFESLGARRAALELLPRHPGYEAAGDRSFDDRHGTDTAGRIETMDLGIDAGLSQDQAVLYLPSPQRVTNWMLDRAGVEPATTTFVDLGCGKGRVVLTAAMRPFRRVVGIEISSALAGVARANVAAFRSPPELVATVEIVEADATQIDLPDGDLLVHLYHPFEIEVTEIVLQRLEASLRRSPRRVTVAYLAYTEAIPRVRDVIAGFPWLHEERYEQSVRGHYDWLLLTATAPR